MENNIVVLYLVITILSCIGVISTWVFILKNLDKSIVRTFIISTLLISICMISIGYAYNKHQEEENINILFDGSFEKYIEERKQKMNEQVETELKRIEKPCWKIYYKVVGYLKAMHQ